MVEPLVSHISDTARWVAVYRAIESARPDALFRDALADRLAGDRGRQILAKMPKAVHGWPMVIRTKAIDDLVLEAIADGADRVINLAAGLDARPFRLELPPELVWVEADLPEILDEKERILKRETPRCRVVRERVDLADAAARGRFLDRSLDGARRAVVVSEGLLIYLEAGAVMSLARDLASRAAIATWVLDLVSPTILRMLKRQVDDQFSRGVELRFAPKDGVAFLASQGWRPTAVRSLMRDAFRMNRLPWFLHPVALLPEPDPARPGRRPWSAVVRLERTTPAQTH